MTVNKKYIIIRDRVEIYKDFTLNLLYYIIDYYLDDKTLSDDVDIKNHFNFCFNKVCDEFNKEGIDFSKNEVLREYFYQFYYLQFYKINKDSNSQDITIAHFIKFWKNVFNFEKQKNQTILSTLIEIYTVFDTSMNKEKNILELV
jgi:hypothetical protein